MKKLVFLFLTISNFAFGQKKDLVGNWISNKNEMIAISASDEVQKQTITNAALRNEEFYLEILDDTLSFQDKYYSSSENYEKLHIIPYNLKILQLTDSILLVAPVSKASVKFFNTDKPIKFVNQNFIRNDDFNFERLIFTASSCFGSCPVIKLKIKANKEIELKTQDYKDGMGMQIDEDKSGNYYGKLNDRVFSELIDLIIKSKIETLNISNEILCCDGAVKTIELYHNGKKNYVQTMFEPRMLRELISFLYTLREKTELFKTDQKFDF
ncbi:DUF6438 domain-containing protein [Zunongwangia sp. H14]|uniref:DUF6438 domain-containing protein n=1 Tax=Zunongwangia sp. H14 TaxID=3240792 RepID=UPI0035649BB9